VQARKLGLDVAVVTSCGPDVLLDDVAPGAQWRVVASDETTTFQNLYEGGLRQQRVLAQASRLDLTSIPVDWRSASIALVAPVLYEIAETLPRELKSAQMFLGIGAQGWLRRLENGTVRLNWAPPTSTWLKGADAVFLSDEDVAGGDIVGEDLESWRPRVPLLIQTRGRRGATIWHEYGWHDIPAYTADEVDPTGAGDVFMTAFAIRYRETGMSLESGRFAAAAAALSVMKPGLEGIGGREDIAALRREQAAVEA
jgi:sugar/nucleoside kinase (ribokinase family)